MRCGMTGRLSGKLLVRPGSVRLLGVIYFIFFANGMMSTYLGAILPAMTKEYSLSYSMSGSLFSFHQIGNFCAIILAGFLPYLIGRKKSILLLASGIVLGLLLMTVNGATLVLCLAFIMTGLGRGTLSNITNVVVAENIGNKTAGLNLLHASFSTGAIIGPLLAMFTASHDVWKLSAWIISGVMVCALILLALSSLDNSPQERKAQDEGAKFWKFKSFWLVVLILFFYLCAESSFMGWLVTYFADTGRLNAEIAPSVSSLLWLMIFAGRMLVAFVSTQIDKKKLLVVLSICMFIFFIMMISTTRTYLTIIGLLGVGLSMAGIYPTALSTLNNKFNSSTIATGTCIASATIGGIIMPSIVGNVAERAGLSAGISTIGGALAVLIVLVIIRFFIREE